MPLCMHCECSTETKWNYTRLCDVVLLIVVSLCAHKFTVQYTFYIHSMAYHGVFSTLYCNSMAVSVSSIHCLLNRICVSVWLAVVLPSVLSTTELRFVKQHEICLVSHRNLESLSYSEATLILHILYIHNKKRIENYFITFNWCWLSRSHNRVCKI